MNEFSFLWGGDWPKEQNLIVKSSFIVKIKLCSHSSEGSILGAHNISFNSVTPFFLYSVLRSAECSVAYIRKDS